MSKKNSKKSKIFIQFSPKGIFTSWMTFWTVIIGTLLIAITIFLYFITDCNSKRLNDTNYNKNRIDGLQDKLNENNIKIVELNGDVKRYTDNYNTLKEDCASLKEAQKQADKKAKDEQRENAGAVFPDKPKKED